MPEPRRWDPLRLNFGTPDVNEAPEAVVGRDEDVRAFWDAVRAGSIRLLSERRMGKTWLLKLALARSPEKLECRRRVRPSRRVHGSMPGIWPGTIAHENPIGEVMIRFSTSIARFDSRNGQFLEAPRDGGGTAQPVVSEISAGREIEEGSGPQTDYGVIRR